MTSPLRLYADRDLVTPRVVDPANGYRYYGADQVRTGWLIALLRSTELSSDDIADIAGIVGVSAPDGPGLLERAADAAQRRAEGNQAVLARAGLISRGQPSMTEPTTRTGSERRVLSVELAQHGQP